MDKTLDKFDVGVDQVVEQVNRKESRMPISERTINKYTPISLETQLSKAEKLINKKLDSKCESRIENQGLLVDKHSIIVNSEVNNDYATGMIDEPTYENYSNATRNITAAFRLKKPASYFNNF